MRNVLIHENYSPPNQNVRSRGSGVDNSLTPPVIQLISGRAESMARAITGHVEISVVFYKLCRLP